MELRKEYHMIEIITFAFGLFIGAFIAQFLHIRITNRALVVAEAMEEQRDQAYEQAKHESERARACALQLQEIMTKDMGPESDEVIALKAGLYLATHTGKETTQ